MDLIDELENDLLELDEQHQKHQQKDHSTGLEENEDGHNQLHVASGEEYKDELRRAATFYYSGKLEELQSDIVAFEGQKDNAEESQELLSRAISALEQSEQEITDIHSLINSKFSKFIPELSTLVPSIKEYVKAVEIIINKEDLSELKKFVSNNGVFLVLSIQLKNSPFDLGKDVPANDRAFILDGCLVIEKLFAFNELVVSYLEKIMIFLCPNIVCLVGSRIAAQLVGTAGGTVQLSRIPSCNIINLGKNQNVNSKIGLSNYVSYLKNGYIYHSDLVQNVSEDIQKKVMKMLAGKLALVARVDSRAESRDGSIGRLYRKEIEDKIEKLEEPPPTRGVKAMDLPGILDGNKKTRRGGKRKRKFNEKYQMSDLERQQNRVLFGVEEEEVFMEGGEETEGLGMLGQKGSGLLRMGQMTTANRLKTKSNQKANATSGANHHLSALAFTADQGLQLLDPSLNKKKQEDNSKQTCFMFTGSKVTTRHEVTVTKRLVEESEIDSLVRRVNQYTIKRTIGEGAYATVLYAVDDKKQEYALKEISKSRISRKKRTLPGQGLRSPGGQSPTPVDAGLLSIQNEIEILKRLQHKNVITLYEVIDDEESDLMYLVFEYCKKGVVMEISLDTVSKPFKESQCWDLFRQLITGLKYCHDRKVAHRDIKPDNLLITSSGTLKISDFGVSYIIDSGNTIDGSAGSPAFIAPELLSSDQSDRKASLITADIWAAGVTLYCFVYGKLPFIGENIIEMNKKIKAERPLIDPKTNHLLADLLMKLLEKDPHKRITLQDVCEHPWITRNGKKPLLPKITNARTTSSEIIRSRELSSESDSLNEGPISCCVSQ